MNALEGLAPPAAQMRTLIDDLLAEQQSLTAVDRFSQKHAHGQMPAQARYYRELIPLRKPERGEQYAFAVDLDACTGCKSCVNACHSLNGLDDDEIWRNVGVIIGGTVAEPYQQTVTTTCHHCAQPGCLLGCPVGAYEKDAATGIVRHLDDQCIGCGYCLLKCPYDVPKYSKERGIVRKCDMCYDRLAAEEAPACVQACPSGAITIRLASTMEMRTDAKPDERLIHGAFDSNYTKPTTSYTTWKAIPANARPGDDLRLRLENAHWPLIWLLLLSQLSAGMFVCLAVTTLLPAKVFASIAPPLALTGFAALQAGLISSCFHLGRPLRAWRIFLGLRTSWMSREILVFGIFAAAAGTLALVTCWPTIESHASSFLGGRTSRLMSDFAAAGPTVFPTGWKPVTVLAIVTAGTALGGIFCSAMIYVDTRRPFWRASVTFPKFFGTTLLLGAAGSATVLSCMSAANSVPFSVARTACIAGLIFSVLHTAWEEFFFHNSLRDPRAPTHRSARTIWKFLPLQLRLRALLIAAAAPAGAIAIFAPGSAQALGATAYFLFTFGSAVVERYCFFAASDAPRMPGGIA
jgi:Fe-S-cluster-containing dehydrogenase component/DMSO reductase anchor subunit